MKGFIWIAISVRSTEGMGTNLWFIRVEVSSGAFIKSISVKEVLFGVELCYGHHCAQAVLNWAGQFPKMMRISEEERSFD